MVQESLKERLETFSGALVALAERQDDERVHGLRVAIRRLSQTLRMFEPALPAGVARKIRRKLKRLLRRAGSVRDCDIVLHLLRKADAHKSTLGKRLRRERASAATRLVKQVRKMQAKESVARWARKLRLT